MTLEENQPQIGLWNSLCSNFAADVVSFGRLRLGASGKHSPNDLHGAWSASSHPARNYADCAAALERFLMVKRLLNAGAPGLLFPMIRNAEEAEATVAATRYPPNGIRGVSMTQRGNQFDRVGDYWKKKQSSWFKSKPGPSSPLLRKSLLWTELTESFSAQPILLPTLACSDRPPIRMCGKRLVRPQLSSRQQANPPNLVQSANRAVELLSCSATASALWRAAGSGAAGTWCRQSPGQREIRPG